MQVGKYIVFHLVKHTESFYSQSVEEESKSQRAVNDFISSWHPRVRQYLGAHALQMAGEWDWLGIFTMDELSDWEAFREEYKRRFRGRVEKSLSLPGVSHDEFIRATSGIEHYKRLREDGVYPGGAEKDRAGT